MQFNLLTQIWCIRGLVGAEETGLKEIELSAAIHLAFHELERLSFVIWPSVCPLDHREAIAA